MVAEGLLLGRAPHIHRYIFQQKHSPRIMNINYIFLRSAILEEVEYLKEMVSKSERLWGEEHQFYKKIIDEQSSNLDEYETALLKENSGQRLHELNHVLPNMQRQASLILLSSYIEKNLVSICEVIEKTKLGKNEKFLKSDNKILENIEKYLTSATKNNFPKDNIYWKEIKDVRMIRNRVVHNGTLVEKKNTSCRKYIRKCRYLETRNALEKCDDFDKHNILKICINNGFLRHYLELFESFVEDVFKTLDGKPTNIIPLKIKKRI